MKGIFPGTFAPLTLGHLEMIERASKLCDVLYVAVAEEHGRPNSPFTLEERIDFIFKSTAFCKNIKVVSFSGLIVDFAQKLQVDVIIRGLRNSSDFDYEYQMAASNRHMTGIETVFLASSPKYVHISATLIRQIALNGRRLHDFVPKEIEQIVFERLNTKKNPPKKTN
jgi:pantetheine-phosphate adenylyltransferase